ncbi:LysR family transcriptional regulator [Microbacterium sp. W1N]|uniref:LysR family transcriptional regulator n=1 Tax=Microbacterium festucae TaxID=2977531 RepID=UPI0021C11137|nr:LysR family transcriptional regulator [Microbacterium festucae]MCT9821185.1 LysR family transcriptional regulator [Microbacterium festucae]
MDIRHLSVFAAVAQELSFTRAAERLMLAQSAVSTTVRELEGELGVVLFDRSHRQIRLTGAGEALVPRAAEIIDRLREVREVVSPPDQPLRGTVTMGLMTAVSLIDVPALLGRFHRANPGVTVRLRAARLGTAGLITQLEHGEIDVALLSIVDEMPASLSGEVIAASPFVLVVPDDHALAGRERVALSELAGERFVDVPRGYGSRSIIDDAFARVGLERRVLIEVAEIGTAAAYVPHCLGIALVPRFAARAAAGVRVVELVDEVTPFRVSFAYARRRSPLPATAALIELMRREAAPAA